MTNYGTIVIDSVREAAAELRRVYGEAPKTAVLFLRGDLPIAAWAYDGRDGGAIYTRHDVRKGCGPHHRYAGSADAFDELARDVRAADERRGSLVKAEPEEKETTR